VPMGLCYPGKGASGDLGPVAACARHWRAPMLAQLGAVELTLAVGRYAMVWHVPDFDGHLTNTVRNWRAYWPSLVPLPHPSPRNNGWFKANPWFETDALPALRARIGELLGQPAQPSATEQLP
ncbi:MAG: uracil-DNA glycosylase family protein, partial [Novosphingobium sp.]